MVSLLPGCILGMMVAMGGDAVTAVLDRLLDPVGRSLNAEVARRLVGLRADPEAQGRMDELADRCNEGRLTSDERAEYEAYVAAANAIAVLQAKARAVLAGDVAA
jgi:hypothetical protein